MRAMTRVVKTLLDATSTAVHTVYYCVAYRFVVIICYLVLKR